MQRSRTLGLYLSLTMIAALTLAGAPAGADVTPNHVTATLASGQSITVTKAVDVPDVPPKLDLVLDVDLSGSYFDDIATIKGLKSNIFNGVRAQVADSSFGLATYVDYPFNPWGFDGFGCSDYAHLLDQDLTMAQATWESAVDAMTIRCGGDEPESQLESLFQIATGAGRDVAPAGPSLGDVPAGLAPSFRSDATKVVALTTDASMHTAGDSACVSPAPCPFPYPGPTFADTVNALNAANVKVIAIKAPGATGQMDALASATGGAVTTTGSSSAQIVQAIVGALDELTFTVSGDASGCSPALDVSFSPASHTDVAGGTTVTFDETISVPATTPDGVYTCTVEFLADNSPIGTQRIEITVENNQDPDCRAAAPSVAELWPPNHKLHDVTVNGVSDPDGDAVTVSVDSIFQDEPTNTIADGNAAPDGSGLGTSTAQVRAERAGSRALPGNGRVYHIGFSADDGQGGSCTGTVAVGVPHDQGNGKPAVDDGALYDSTV